MRNTCGEELLFLLILAKWHFTIKQRNPEIRSLAIIKGTKVIRGKGMMTEMQRMRRFCNNLHLIVRRKTLRSQRETIYVDEYDYYHRYRCVKFNNCCLVFKL